MMYFCQSPSDVKGRSRLNEVETIETGFKISEAVKNWDSDILKFRLCNAIQSEDGRAADFKYRLLCYVKNVEIKEEKKK